MCLLGTGLVQAAPQPKVNICHFDDDTQAFELISVSGNAIQKHIDNHGDSFPGTEGLDENCVEVIPPAVIARAYIDKNRDGEYKPEDDVEIAELLDTDGNPGLTVGDTIVLGQYPTTLDPCPLPSGDCIDIGNYNPLAPPLLVTAVIFDTNELVGVQTIAGILYVWRHVAGSLDQFQAPNAAITIQDGADGNAFDQINVALGGEPNASDIVPVVSLTNTQDDYFINVEFPVSP